MFGWSFGETMTGQMTEVLGNWEDEASWELRESNMVGARVWAWALVAPIPYKKLGCTKFMSVLLA